MQDPDFMYETTITDSLETVTHTLSENLHLKWNYGLLYVDKYTDEVGIPVSIITGLHRRNDNDFYHLRVQLAGEQKGTRAIIQVWKIMLAGYPLPKSIALTARTDAVDIVDEVSQFCVTPFKEGTGIVSWLSNLFSGDAEKRKY